MELLDVFYFPDNILAINSCFPEATAPLFRCTLKNGNLPRSYRKQYIALQQLIGKMITLWQPYGSVQCVSIQEKEILLNRFEKNKRKLSCQAVANLK